MKDTPHQWFVVETFRQTGEASSAKIRARPIEGQGLPTNMRVRCSKQMREKHAIGSLFLIEAKVTDKEGGNPFLHSPHQWPYKVITESEAKDFIAEHYAKSGE